MSYLVYEVNVVRDQKIVVGLKGRASVRLVDQGNLSGFQSGVAYNYFPGREIDGGVELSPPSAGLWYVVVDRGWFPITEEEVTLSVTPAPTNPWLVAGIVLALAAFVISITSEEPPRSRRRTARPRNTEPLDRETRMRVYERDAGLCTYCGDAVSPGEFDVDHSVSRRNGGTNHLNNLRTACPPCNLSKGALNARQFKVRA